MIYCTVEPNTSEFTILLRTVRNLKLVYFWNFLLIIFRPNSPWPVAKCAALCKHLSVLERKSPEQPSHFFLVKIIK